jgi:hypothetical protein
MGKEKRNSMKNHNILNIVLYSAILLMAMSFIRVDACPTTPENLIRCEVEGKKKIYLTTKEACIKGGKIVND